MPERCAYLRFGMPAVQTDCVPRRLGSPVAQAAWQHYPGWRCRGQVQRGLDGRGACRHCGHPCWLGAWRVCPRLPLGLRGNEPSVGKLRRRRDQSVSRTVPVHTVFGLQCVTHYRCECASRTALRIKKKMPAPALSKLKTRLYSQLTTI